MPSPSRLDRRVTPATATALVGLALHAFLALPLTATEDDSDEPSWTPEHSLEFRGVGEVALSPDGSLVAYVVREALTEGELSEYRSHIFVAATDGSWDRQWTRGESSATSPAFSPDGRSLAFLREGDGEEPKTQVWILSVTGGEARQVTDLEQGVSSFRFSPDGDRLALLASDPETEEEKEAKKEKRDPILVDREHEYAHVYLLDLSTATATPDPAVSAKEHAEQTEPRRLTEGELHVTSLDWLPDGDTLVIAHQPDPLINTGMVAGDLSLVDTDSGEMTPYTTSAGVEGSPMVSPEGRFIAWVGTGEKPEPVGLGDVYVGGADGEGGVWHTEDTPNRSANLVAWRPGAESMLLLETTGTTRQLLELDMNGGTRVVSLEGGEPMDGVVGSPAQSRDGGTVAFTFQTPDRPPEVYAADADALGSDDLAPRRVSSVNVDVPLPPMGETEVVHWTSKDGTPVEGLITYPVDWTPDGDAEPAPLILQVHGGPAGVFTRSFTGGPSIYLTQFFAERGYAVLRPNPRGSTGYGKDFRYANVGDWGYGDYEDLMSGVDWAIEEGIADPDRLYLMGWSYGGYMTSFAVTRTDRFVAASMGAGLPNLVSMVHTTDIPDYLAAHLGAELWEDVEAYERHSAMYRLERITTPTQILHGANDLRVPFDQGRELYLGLERRGVPTEMVTYPRTPHGPREPKLLIDVSPRILAWFEQHTPGESETATGAGEGGL